MSKIYLAGHMLTTGAQMQRNMEKREISEVAPKAEFYVPQDNKEINDKANATQEGLAERIVRHDTDAILWSDTIIIEPLPEALGTHVELGQIKGMKDVAGLIRDAMLSAPTAEKACIAASDIIHHILNQRVYPHYEDIRRFAGATESEDRRSWGINQYVYGVCLDLTGGKGLYSWDEVKNEIRQVQ